MSYKNFLLEREVGYDAINRLNGVAWMERMNMMDRYHIDKAEAQNDNKGSNKKGLGNKGSDNKLMK